MGRRFEAPSAQHAAATGDADAWDVIDRGDDPTVVGSD
jgi:hypothetical protein